MTSKPSKAFWEAVSLVAILFVVLVGSVIYMNGWIGSGDTDDDDNGSSRRRDEDRDRDREDRKERDRKTRGGEEAARGSETDPGDGLPPDARRDCRRRPRREEEDVYEELPTTSEGRPDRSSDRPRDSSRPSSPRTPSEPMTTVRTLVQDTPSGQVRFVIPDDTVVNVSTPTTPRTLTPTSAMFGPGSRGPQPPPSPGAGGLGGGGSSGRASTNRRDPDGGSGTHGSARASGGGAHTGAAPVGGAHSLATGSSTRPTLVPTQGTYPPGITSAGPVQKTFAFVPPNHEHLRNPQVHRVELPEGPDPVALYMVDLLKKRMLDPENARARVDGPELDHHPIAADPAVSATSPLQPEAPAKHASKGRKAKTANKPSPAEVNADTSTEEDGSDEGPRKKGKKTKAEVKKERNSHKKQDTSSAAEEKVKPVAGKKKKRLKTQISSDSESEELSAEERSKAKPKGKSKDANKVPEVHTRGSNANGDHKQQKKAHKVAISTNESASEDLSEEDQNKATSRRQPSRAEREEKAKLERKKKPTQMSLGQVSTEEDSEELEMKDPVRRRQRQRMRYGREGERGISRGRGGTVGRRREEEYEESEMDIYGDRRINRRRPRARDDEGYAESSVFRRRADVGRGTRTAEMEYGHAGLEDIYGETRGGARFRQTTREDADEQDTTLKKPVKRIAQQDNLAGVGTAPELEKGFPTQNNQQQLKRPEHWDDNEKVSAQGASDKPPQEEEQRHEEELEAVQAARKKRNAERKTQRKKQSIQFGDKDEEHEDGVTVANNIANREEANNKEQEEIDMADLEAARAARRFRSEERKEKAARLKKKDESRLHEDEKRKSAQVELPEPVPSERCSEHSMPPAAPNQATQAQDAHGGDLPPSYNSAARNNDFVVKSNMGTYLEPDGEDHQPQPEEGSTAGRPMEKYPVPPDYNSVWEDTPSGPSKTESNTQHAILTEEREDRSKTNTVSPLSSAGPRETFTPSPTTPLHVPKRDLRPVKLRSQAENIMEPPVSKGALRSLDTVMEEGRSGIQETKTGKSIKIEKRVDSEKDLSKTFNLDPQFSKPSGKHKSNTKILEEELGPSTQPAVTEVYHVQPDQEDLMDFKDSPPGISESKQSQRQEDNLWIASDLDHLQAEDFTRAEKKSRALWSDRNPVSNSKLRRESTGPAERLLQKMEEGDVSPGAGEYLGKGQSQQNGLWNDERDNIGVPQIEEEKKQEDGPRRATEKKKKTTGEDSSGNMIPDSSRQEASRLEHSGRSNNPNQDKETPQDVHPTLQQ